MGRVIGKGGANKKGLEEETKTKLYIADRPHGAPVLTIVGLPGHVSQCRERISKFLAQIAR